MTKFLLTYETTFKLEIAHFNGPDQYQAMTRAMSWILEQEDRYEQNIHHATRYEECKGAIENLLYALEHTHGHNVKVDFFIGLVRHEKATRYFPKDYLVDDIALAEIANRYGRRNLSVSPGLALMRGEDSTAGKEPSQGTILATLNVRATTENLAQSICYDTLVLLKKSWNHCPERGYGVNLCVRVTVHETDAIRASCEEWLLNVEVPV